MGKKRFLTKKELRKIEREEKTRVFPDYIKIERQKSHMYYKRGQAFLEDDNINYGYNDVPLDECVTSDENDDEFINCHRNNVISSKRNCLSKGAIAQRMLAIYKPNGEDWMGFKFSKDNLYTVHHIKERRNNGETIVPNLAILTLNAHTFLNYLDINFKEAYEEYQNLFRIINYYGKSPSDDLREDIYDMLLDVFYYNVFQIPQEVLDRYEPYTYRK